MVQSRTHGFRSVAVASGALLLGALLVIWLPSAPASAGEGACVDGDGVTVVVDFTDLGGSIVTGCASGDPATGREALEAAGFAATDSQPGMICAIGAQPDPCPATFEGSYWSYWHSSAAGDWVSYQVGSDSSDPTPGEIEGWRYNDGSTGPGIAPTEVAGAVIVASPAATVGESSPSPSPAAAAAAASAAASASTDRLALFTAIGLAAGIAGLVVVFLVRSRIRRASEED